MSVQFNHLIIPSKDNRESAEFLAHILDVELGQEWGPFIPLETSNGVRLDFATIPPEDLRLQHYAFLVDESEFDGILRRIQQAEVTYHADPQGKQLGEINYNHGGRGVYFRDPGGNGMEVITQPYGADLV
ncbi:glyoxalase [Prauserella marina]|uniref:Gamma-glutamyltranspeptidase / glutathione hydrolase n=1 Tax=Prauserella marina TaxID=530584 RepID=A0A222VQQ9_9PSEU|nr:VOC family protein [Prauserella marina]ASR36240.1 glyoxalase [Prauserella marina]PWV77007.1 extradiol dioxygenase family protein [Prauserella marina]SDD02256.1 gamma-glutamyltranspeptidase / glutathione hydrolase [Prauserella marina]